MRFSISLFFFFLVLIHLGYPMNISTLGGHIYDINTNVIQQTEKWFGIYGKVNDTGNTTVNSSAGKIINFSVYYPDFYGNKTYILTSLSDTISFNNLIRGQPAILDIIYLGYSPSVADSANNTFRQLKDYLFDTFNITNVSVTYTYAYSNVPYFDLGLLYDNSSGHFVYITTVRDNATSYNNHSVNYQMMLPVRKNHTTEEYHFFAYIPTSNGQCNYTLLPGWNLISLCVNPVNHSITSVFSNISGDYLYVRRWESSNQSFDTWSARRNELENPFHELNVNESYFIFINSSSPVNLDLSGSPNPNMNISLVQYWNPPSHPYNFDVSVNQLVLSISDTYRYVRKWNASDQYFITYSRYAVHNPFHIIYLGEGLFIYTNQSDVLVYDYH